MRSEKKMPRKCWKHFEALTGSISSGRNQYGQFNAITPSVQREAGQGKRSARAACGAKRAQIAV
jgi:hypothetical protein